MNILMLSHSSGKSGAEKVFMHTLDILSKSNNVTLVLPNKKRDILEYVTVSRDSYNVITYYYRLMGNSCFKVILKLFLSIMAMCKLRKFVIKNNIEIIYVNTIVNWTGLIVGLLTRKKVILHVHEHPSDSEKYIDNRLDRILRKLLEYSNVHLIFISKEMKKKWEERIGNHCNSVVYNPLMISKSESNNKISSINKTGCIVVGFAGTLYKRKNVKLLIDAIKYLSDEIKIKLIIAGDGPQKRWLENYIHELNIEDDVNLVGQISNINDFFSGIDIFVLPSLAEAMPLVVLEAVINYVPCIVTKNTGINEILMPGEDYLSINPNKVESLVEAIKLLIIKDMIRKNLPVKAHRSLMDFHKSNDFDKIILRLLDEY